MLLVGCAFPWSKDRTAAPPFPHAAHRIARREEFQSDLNHPALVGAPEYTLRLDVDPAARVITGTAHITVTNRTADPWSTIALRTFPNLAHYAGTMEIRQLTVNGQPVPFSLNASGTALLADLVEPLASGRRARLAVAYRVRYRRLHAPGYILFGEWEGVINLPLAYPVVAVPEPGGGWRLDDGIPLGDTLTAETGFFHAWVTVPNTLTLISSAVVSATTPLTTTARTRYELVSGPAREFTLLLGPAYAFLERNVQGVRVRSYFLPGDEAAAEAALTYATAALQVYSRRFGPYPFAKMDIAAAMLLNRGMEYPQLNMLGVDLYRRARKNLEFLVAHEVAHQWWYNLVGNDQVREPWLDEGLTEYSTYFYYEDVYGRERAEALRQERWEIPVAYVRQSGLDAPLDLPAAAYTRENYENIVYAKGALFFHTLRTYLGDAAFQKALRLYLNTYRYRLATARDLERTITRATGRNVHTLFAEWVYGKTP